jgi:opacity protein-like surface antigen
MKNSSIHKVLATIVTSALVANYSTQTLTAEAIDSQVIHNYSEISLGYSYLHDIANTDLNAHGVVGAASFEVQNFIFGLGGGYHAGDKDFGVGLKTDLYTLTGGIGYAIRLAENRVNVIPNLALAYSKISASIPDLGSAKEEATVIQPGVTVSFAINNRWSINAGYLYSHDLDSNNDGGNSHALRLGTRVALAERVGLDIGAVFIEDYGFSGINAGVSFHF